MREDDAGPDNLSDLHDILNIPVFNDIAVSPTTLSPHSDTSNFFTFSHQLSPQNYNQNYNRELVKQVLDNAQLEGNVVCQICQRSQVDLLLDSLGNQHHPQIQIPTMV